MSAQPAPADRPLPPTEPPGPAPVPADTPPDLRRLWRAARGPLLVGMVLVALAAGLAAGSSRSRRALDPQDASARGARALAELLRQRQVAVVRDTEADGARTGVSTATTLFVPEAAAYSPAQLSGLAAAGAELVLVAPDDARLRALGLSLSTAGRGPVQRRQPACRLPVAGTAGDAEIGGRTYLAAAAAAACYPADGHPTLIVTTGKRRVTVLGSAEAFGNERLARPGNAALALGLLGAQPRLRWLVPPAPTSRTPDPSERRGVLELLPDRLLWALLMAAIGVLLLAAWRARRLGPLVDEPLPVVVRAAETVHGRARLYRAANARTHAATELREAARARLTPGLGLGTDPRPAVVVDAVTRQTGLDRERVADLLYGAAPGATVPAELPDDAALVRLALALDDLEERMRAPIQSLSGYADR